MSYVGFFFTPLEEIFSTLALPASNPKDTVFKGIVSVVYSFTATLIVTKGNYVAASKAASLALLATLIYSLTLSLFSEFVNSVESFFLAVGTIACLIKTRQFQASWSLSVLATLLPWTLRKGTLDAPIFGIVYA